MNPYELLGVATDATLAEIKKAHRKLAKELHPDKHDGDVGKFREVQLAYEVLSDPERRDRYDKTGRTEPSRVTLPRIKEFLRASLRACVHAEGPGGRTDDPSRENIRDNLIANIESGKAEAVNRLGKHNKKMKRARQLLERFKRRGKGDDMVGDILRDEVAEIQKSIDELNDAMEMADAAIEQVGLYWYKVDPRDEGPVPRGPTVFPTSFGVGRSSRPS